MAFLVCFRSPGLDVDWSKKAIYLDQSFYELVFNYFKYIESDSPLKAIISIGYDDELVIVEDQIMELLIDLKQIAASGKVVHPQIPLLCSVLREAASKKWGLAVAGDMHPDRSQKTEKDWRGDS